MNGTERVIYMTKAEKIEKLRNLTQGFILHSLFTRMPFVECEMSSFYDQAFLFETREDAEEAARRMCENGDMVGVTELKLVEAEMPQQTNGPKLVKPGEPVKRFLRNQIREQLMLFPRIGLNAVFFKAAGERGEVLTLDEVLPDPVKEELNKEPNERSGLQLTGMYFAQYVRRKDADPRITKERYEEFYMNLARVKMLLPVIPGEEGIQPDGNLNLTRCKLPVFSPRTKTEEGAEQPEQEKVLALALFSNMDEVAVHSRSHINDVKVVQVGLDEVPKFVPEEVKYCVIDPLTLSITIKTEDILKIWKALKGQS